MASNKNPAMRNAFSTNLEKFTKKLYPELRRLDPNTNLIYSPLSIQTCVAMLRMGAEFPCVNELDEVLCFSPRDEYIIAEMFHLMMTDCANCPLLNIANKIYTTQGCGILPYFKNLITEKFLAEIESVNFNDNVRVAGAINNWVAGKTNNMIKKIVTSDNFDGFSRLVLVNAIHFKGCWLKSFNQNATTNEDFHINNDQTIKVPMMYKKDYFGYGELYSLNAQVLEMKYVDSDLSMLVILPRAKSSLQQLDKQLQCTTFAEIFKQLQRREVRVKFPRFKTEFTQDLTQTFKSLGIRNIFSGQCFRNIFNYNQDIAVTSIIHKAIIEVSEEGAEAAAVTFLQTDGYVPTINFIAKRPFYFVILKNRSMPIFEGTITRPM